MFKTKNVTGVCECMIGDKRRFFSLKEVKGNNVTLGDSTSAIIMGTKIVSVDMKKLKMNIPWLLKV